MEEALKGFLIATGTLITIVIISLALRLADSAKGLTGGVLNLFDHANVAMSETDKTKYSGNTISGAEVVNCIRKFKPELTVSVRRKDASGTLLNAISFAGTGTLVNLPSSSSYINPNAYFLGEVSRNANDAIVGIHFTQTQAVSNAGGGGGSGGSGSEGGTGGGGNTEQLENLMAQFLTSMGEQTSKLNGVITQLNQLNNTFNSLGEVITLQGNQLNDMTAQMGVINDSLENVSLSIDELARKIQSDGSSSTLAYDEMEVRGAVTALSESLQEVNTSLEELMQSADLSDPATNRMVQTLRGIAEDLEEKITKLTFSTGELYVSETPENEDLFLFEFGKNESGEAMATLDSSGTLVVTCQGDAVEFSNEKSVPWYSVRDQIKEVVFENSSNLTSLSNWFVNCTKLERVSGLTSLNSMKSMRSTFKGCTALVSVGSLPPTVKELSFTFSGCASLVTAEDISKDAITTRMFEGTPLQ